MQKDQTRQRYTVEIWTPDGVRIKEFIATTSAVHKVPVLAAPNQSRFIRGGGNIQIAWMRWYTGVVPLNSSIPKDFGAAKGDLGNWEFEGNLNDDSGNGLNVTRATDQCDGGSLQRVLYRLPSLPAVCSSYRNQRCRRPPDGSGCFRVVHVRR